MGVSKSILRDEAAVGAGSARDSGGRDRALGVAAAAAMLPAASADAPAERGQLERRGEGEAVVAGPDEAGVVQLHGFLVRVGFGGAGLGEDWQRWAVGVAGS